MELDMKLPEKVHFLFESWRYKVLWGGRGSAKTESMARALIILSLQRKTRILCLREIMHSLKDSSHKVLRDVIESTGLDSYFTVTDKSIKCNPTGSEFIFAGLASSTAASIKSISNINIAWCDEADVISERSLELLLPSIRGGEDSELWFSFNPHLKEDPVYQMFIVHGYKLDNAKIVRMNWNDNPFFPEVLKKTLEQCKERDYQKYLQIWEGECAANTEASVFAGKYTSYDFTPDETVWSPLFGSDLGFAADALTLTKSWFYEDTLYVEHELYEHGLSIDLMPAYFDTIPGAKEHIIFMDSSRPETINHMKRHGYPRCMPVKKWKGSVEDGLERMRAFNQIVIHPRCKHALEEFKTYSYKVDKHTNLVLPEIVGKDDHVIDSIRYACQPLILNWKLKTIPDRPDKIELDSLGLPIFPIHRYTGGRTPTNNKWMH